MRLRALRLRLRVLRLRDGERVTVTDGAGRWRPCVVAGTTIEAIAGIPSIVLALFGTVIFSSTDTSRRPRWRTRSTSSTIFCEAMSGADSLGSVISMNVNPSGMAGSVRSTSVGSPASASRRGSKVAALAASFSP